MQEYRQAIHCTGACSIPDSWKDGFPTHISSCRANRWAVGPILNFIQDVVEFETPVPCSGNLGKWPLGWSELQQIKKQLSAGKYRISTNATDFPTEAGFERYLYLYIYILCFYIYIYIYICIYIYTYIYI